MSSQWVATEWGNEVERTRILFDRDPDVEGLIMHIERRQQRFGGWHRQFTIVIPDEERKQLVEELRRG